MKAMTLRLSDEQHERLRKQAFEERTTITALVLAAIDKAAPHVPGGCDVCGATPARITTPGAIRLCDDHGNTGPNAVKQIDWPLGSQHDEPTGAFGALRRTDPESGALTEKGADRGR